jgi:predicted ArsR family transcriptional regulator
MYMLTEKGATQFPNNYQHLALTLLEQLRAHLPPSSVNVILEGVADDMAIGAAIPDVPLHERLQSVVEYLSAHGYQAYVEGCDDGYILHTANCPYHHAAQQHPSLCEMDMRLVAHLLGVVPRRMMHRKEGDDSCSYFVPAAISIE